MDIKQDPGTPSKAGTKRKSDAQVTLFGKAVDKAAAKTRKAQPKKAAASKPRAKKETKKEVQGINSVFKATKSSTKATGKAASKVPGSSLKIIPSKFNGPSPLPNENFDGSLQVQKKRKPSTPRKEPRLTQIKPEYVMQTLSDSDHRNNQSPERPQVEDFTPIKARTPSDQLRDEFFSYAKSQPSESRPSTADSQRNMIESPTGTLPRGMAALLH
jgi:NAD+-dependent protein deacetylase SIR2